MRRSNYRSIRRHHPLRWLLLPLVVVLTLIQWLGVFEGSFAAVILEIGAVLLLMTSIVMWGFGAGTNAAWVFVLAFVMFLLPIIALKLWSWLVELNLRLRDYIAG